jgi:glycosyltransferase involved in cell wall biosynthesis
VRALAACELSMTSPETNPPTGSVPAVSVLIATYNRSALLPRAIASVLKQDFADFELVVVDDHSTDATPDVMAGYDDPRIRYVRNARNIGGEGGDRSIIQRFVNEQARGKYFIYLCDDDYWRPADLLSRQVDAMEKYPSLAFVQGGMAHCYPHRVPLMVPNEPYIRYSHVDGQESDLFWGALFPAGFMTSETYLRLFAEDPKNRNIVIGATMFHTQKFRAARTLERSDGVKWQAGYAILAGAATQGDVFYIDEPCVMTAVDINNASHRGTQLLHFQDCLNSIDAAFGGVQDNPALMKIRNTMALSVFKIYICNKIANKFGWFKTNALGDISHVLIPEITAREFFDTLEEHGVALSEDNRDIIRLSDCSERTLQKLGWTQIVEMASDESVPRPVIAQPKPPPLGIGRILRGAYRFLRGWVKAEMVK